MGSVKKAMASSLTVATRRTPTLGPRSFTTVQASMNKIKQSFTEDGFIRQREHRERLDKTKLEKLRQGIFVNENAPNLMRILEDGGVPVAMRETLKTQLLLWKHEDVSR